MNELPLIFAVIAATIAVMLWLLVIFRHFFRLREERAPEVVHAAPEAEASPPRAPSKNMRPARPASDHSHGLAA